MAASTRLLAKRALVTILLELARLYSLTLTVTRESEDKVVEAAYKKLVLKVHPDKGGCTSAFQKLQAAREKWLDSQKTNPAKGGRPQKTVPETAALPDDLPEGLNSVYRIQSSGILLTYQKTAGPEGWDAFCKWVEGKLKTWQVRYWCATLELCQKGQHHVHLMLQFTSARERTLDDFWYKGLKPNASTNDLCGEGRSGKKLQQSLDRAFFYVYADKKGTARDAAGKQCTCGNYWPAWTEESMTYQAGWVKLVYNLVYCNVKLVMRM
jgi:curved DNA-binding protein CbpA